MIRLLWLILLIFTHYSKGSLYTSKNKERQGRTYIPTLSARQIVNLVKSAQDSSGANVSPNDNIKTTKEYYNALLSYLQNQPKNPQIRTNGNRPGEISSKDIEKLVSHLRQIMGVENAAGSGSDSIQISNEDFPSLISLLSPQAEETPHQVTIDPLRTSQGTTQTFPTATTTYANPNQYESVPFFPALHGDSLRNVQTSPQRGTGTPAQLPSSSQIPVTNVPVRSSGGLSSLLDVTRTGTSFAETLDKCRESAACLLITAGLIAATALSPFAISIGAFKRKKRSLSFEEADENAHMLDYANSFPDKVRYVDGYVLFDDNPLRTRRRIWKRSIEGSKVEGEELHDQKNIEEANAKLGDATPEVLEKGPPKLPSEININKKTPEENKGRNEGKASINFGHRTQIALQNQLMSLLKQVSGTMNQLSNPPPAEQGKPIYESHSFSKSEEQANFDRLSYQNSQPVNGMQLLQSHLQSNEDDRNKLIVIPESFFQKILTNNKNQAPIFPQQTLTQQNQTPMPINPQQTLTHSSPTLQSPIDNTKKELVKDGYYGIIVDKEPSKNIPQFTGLYSQLGIHSSDSQQHSSNVNTASNLHHVDEPSKGIASLSFNPQNFKNGLESTKKEETNVEDNPNYNSASANMKNVETDSNIKIETDKDKFVPFNILRRIIEGASTTPNRLYPIMSNLPPLPVLSHEQPSQVLDKVNQNNPPQRFNFAPTILDPPIQPSNSGSSTKMSPSFPGSSSHFTHLSQTPKPPGGVQKPSATPSFQLSREVRKFYTLLCEAILLPDVPLNQITAYIAEKCLVMRFTKVI